MWENAFEGILVSSQVYRNTFFGPIKQITLRTPLVVPKQARGGMGKKGLNNSLQILESRHSAKLHLAQAMPHDKWVEVFMNGPSKICGR